MLAIVTLVEMRDVNFIDDLMEPPRTSQLHLYSPPPRFWSKRVKCVGEVACHERSSKCPPRPNRRCTAQGPPLPLWSPACNASSKPKHPCYTSVRLAVPQC